MELGCLVVFKTHAYTYNINPIKISANALLTPPIMIVDQLTFNDVGKKSISKVRCRFYNSSTNKIEEEWFDLQELQLLNTDSGQLSDSTYEQFGRYTLKSCIHELKKLKAVFQIENTQTKSFATSFLNHLPPVFVATDSVSLSIKGNSKLKDFCSTGYKVKWFNPDSGKFREDILPAIVLAKLGEIEDISIINQAIEEKWIYLYKLDNPIVIPTTEKTLSDSLFRVIDVRYNHVSVIIKVRDMLLNKEFEMPLEKFNEYIGQDIKLFNDYFVDKFPKLIGDVFLYPHEAQLEIGLIYGVTYINAQGEKTIRSIIPLRVLEPKTEENEGQLLEAFCLLRCEIRYFWTKRIVQLLKSGQRVI